MFIFTSCLQVVPTLTLFPSLTLAVRVGKSVRLGKVSGSEKAVRLGNLNVRVRKAVFLRFKGVPVEVVTGLTEPKLTYMTK